MVPRRTKVCERILEEEGVFGDIQLNEFNLDLVPFDDDLASLEMDSAFRELSLVRRWGCAPPHRGCDLRSHP